MAATFVCGLALAIGGTALVALLSHSLVLNVQRVAELRADDIAALALSGHLPAKIASEEDSIVQVVDSFGRVIASSENVAARPTISKLHPVGDNPLGQTLDHVPVLKGQFRLLAIQAQSPQGLVTIYVATSLEHANDTTALVRKGLLAGGPLLLALVAAMTWASVGRSLRPVEAIRAQVSDISSRDLTRRVPVPDTTDEISRLAITMNAMLDRLQSAAERQQRFVADASHELQSPLAAARTALEVALAHPDAADWPTTGVDLLDQNRRMENLVADLLFIAHEDSASRRPAFSPIDLHEVVLEEATRLAGQGRVRIDTTEVKSAFVLGRRNDLARAIRNLLDNAIRHASSTIKLILIQNDKTITFTVEDDGPGIPSDERLRIFERFTRLDDARTRTSGGTGLGLAIVKEIVEGHSGTVTAVDSSGGARLVVNLPAD